MAFWAKLKATMTRAWVERSRLKIADEEKISFYIKDETRKIQKLKVQNISLGGIGLNRADFPNADLSRNIEAELRIESDKVSENVSSTASFKVLATIVHISETTVGLRFNMITPEFEMALEQYFKAELLGAKLNLVDKKYLKPENNILPIWLTDGRNNEIYILADKSGILNFHLNFMGHYVEGEKDKRVRVGHIIQTEKSQINKGSDLISMDPQVHKSSLSLARDFVSNARGIETPIQNELLKMLA